MELVLNKQFTEMSHQEMMDVDGGGGITAGVIIKAIIKVVVGSAVTEGTIIFATGRGSGEHFAAAMHATVDAARSFSGPNPRMIAGRTKSSR